MKRSCGTCELSHLVRDQEDRNLKQRFCRAKPPVVAFVPIQRADAVRMEPRTTFPAVEDHHWCGEYRAAAKVKQARS